MLSSTGSTASLPCSGSRRMPEKKPDAALFGADADELTGTRFVRVAPPLVVPLDSGIVDEQGKLIGVFTDGDLRRVIDARKDVHATLIKDVMTKNCYTARKDMLVAETLTQMENRNISGLIVVDDEQRPIGALNMLDMVKSGVV